MGSQDVVSFFEQAYSDRKLQGALYHALAASAPEVVTEIAKARGHTFTTEDLQGLLAEGEVEGFSAQVSANALSQRTLSSNFWAKVSRPVVGGLESAFRLTIPGPSFVQVMGTEDAPDAGDKADRPSAVEIYDGL